MLRFLKPLCLVVGVGMLAGCNSLLTGSSGSFDDGTRAEEAPDTAVVNRIMEGLGGVNPDNKPINYAPRSPLAMPASETDLPPPEDPAAAEEKVANFPVDQEEKDAARRQAATLKEMERLKKDEAPLLTKEEIEAGRISGAGEKGRPRNYLERLRQKESISPRLTRAEMDGQRVDVPDTDLELDPGEVPERRYLVEPPSDFRKPAPNAPVGPPENKSKVNKWLGDLF
ncbi:hypothetical protein [Rhodobium gokarnense]|uniref:DUF3035 domain-containing protein n=1 Tax=Rhodobium gokarnense TaxID=364296 RepID=A0ABT3HCQ7_9HYPH|nr:hypothetical protein [Rhodobium gokarnense]MCW2308167.1 hypothetical protein [Rhodobium gokarnense]